MVVLLAASPGFAQSGPFAQLAGAWSGTGTIKLAEGGTERIKCKASYDLVTSTSITLSLTCASDSYKFALLGSMQARGGTITWTWTESTRNVAGSISGRISGNHISVTTSGALNAGLSLTTSGSTQTVSLSSKGTSIQQVSISMRRS
jgi:hypothetical protein